MVLICKKYLYVCYLETAVAQACKMDKKMINYCLKNIRKSLFFR